MRSAHLVIALIAVGYLLLTAGIGFAEETTFTLAPRQSVTVGQYTATYLGLTANGWPMYGLYAHGGTLATLPSNPPASGVLQLPVPEHVDYHDDHRAGRRHRHRCHDGPLMNAASRPSPESISGNTREESRGFRR